MRKILFVFATGLVIGFSYWSGKTASDIKWRNFDHNTKYIYERISPDSVVLTVCTTQTIYLKEK